MVNTVARNIDFSHHNSKHLWGVNRLSTSTTNGADHTSDISNLLQLELIDEIRWLEIVTSDSCAKGLLKKGLAPIMEGKSYSSKEGTLK
jgi:hypothetical protein